MFEAKVEKGVVLKKILDAVKDLVTEASWECTSNGMSLQAMDTSHVSLVTVSLNGDGFQRFRCDRNMVIGMNLVSLSKILKCASNDDKITIKAGYDDNDKMMLTFEAPNDCEVSEYEIKLMNLDSEYLGIPDTKYDVIVKMPSAKFQRICRDLSQIGDTVVISCTKSGIQFSSSGDLGNGSVRLSQSANIDKPEEAVTITMQEAITQTFALKYLIQFAKATPLCAQVTLQLSSDVPLAVQYKVIEVDADDIETDLGSICYYLAPKIDDATD